MKRRIHRESIQVMDGKTYRGLVCTTNNAKDA
jgi:hypothetical protein